MGICDIITCVVGAGCFGLVFTLIRLELHL